MNHPVFPLPQEGIAQPEWPQGAEKIRRVLSPLLVSISETAGAQAETIRALRTHVMARHIHLGRRALAVCAASRGVGCTFVAANLAVALSQIGVNTLLIDGNLRSPGVDWMIRPAQSEKGLRHCLASPTSNFSEDIEGEVLPNLSVMFAGGAAANAQELLAAERFRALMDFCLRDFDATIIDTPPANTCSDARRIASVAGYCVIVARRHKTFVEDVKILTSQMQGDHARVVGTVLNEA